jgi:tRNA uracil 4-sulfurtransferase
MSETMPVISVQYAEIALKGKNRRVFLQRLKNNIGAALKGEPVSNINHVESRILVRLKNSDNAERIVEKLRRVFGIQWLSLTTPILRTDDHQADLQRVSEVAGEKAVRDAAKARNFKVKTRRSDKSFPMTSPQISAHIGDRIQPGLDLPVKMSHPDFTVHVLILVKEILVFTQKINCYGGLPVGSSGRLTVLLSGGIDSPVAAFMMMKRGCRPEFVHFYAGKTIEEADTEKIFKLAALLARYAPRPMILHMVPAYPYETRSIGTIDDSYDMVMFRRFMVKVSERFALRENCLALVTGDSVGQVASQTLHNLNAISPDVRLPIFRPLVGLNKIEITDISRETGLFETSVMPYRDCCSIRSPKPVLNAKPDRLLELSETMDLPAAVDEACYTSTRFKIGPDGPLESLHD